MLTDLGNLDKEEGRTADAEKDYNEALTIRTSSGSLPEIAETTCDLGNLYRSQQRYDEAETLYKKARELKRKAILTTIRI